MNVRAATHAGTWYPNAPESLRAVLDSWLGKHTDRPQQPLIALIGPHAGLRYSGEVAAAGYAQLKQQKVRRVFLLGPSHHIGFDGIALPAEDVDAYATPLGNLRIDHAAVTTLRQSHGFDGPARAHLPEHSLEMHAVFIAAVQPNALLVPLVVGRVRSNAHAQELAASIRPLLRADDVVIVSSDFTHFGSGFGYTPFDTHVPEQLQGLLDRAYAFLSKRDLPGFTDHLEKTRDSICGKDPIRVLLALLPDDSTPAELARDTSGRMTDDYSSSVSYLAVGYTRKGGWSTSAEDTQLQQGPQVLDAEEQQKSLTMVRQTLEAYLGKGETLDDNALGVPASGAFREELSVFVTLTHNGQLRGCIGHILPVQPLWRDIRDNAIAAAVHDRRFQPVTRAELDSLHLEVSVLTRPVPIPGPEQFEVGRHGIILSLDNRRAVFLPQVAPEQGWDRPTTLTHLARKAGLPADAWQNPAATLEVFEAQVFGEPH